MLADVLHIAHCLKRLVLVSLPYHVCSIMSEGKPMFSFTLYLCMVGRDLGTSNFRSVNGSFRRGPYFLKACLIDFNFNFLASVLASDCLKIHIRFCISILFAAKV